jgi:glycogen phosphorylase
VEPGLGNGGLGRLAACYMDSLATLNIPAIGYGIHYEFGIFRQEIVNGWQVEATDKWLLNGNPWEIARPDISFEVRFGGHTENYVDDSGRYRAKWVPDKAVRSIAYDIPILGHQGSAANFIRLWKAEACESFDFQSFNVGDYYKAVREKIGSENITKILYPNDEHVSGKRLRLEQQYFFVSSSLQDMLRIYRQRSDDLSKFAGKYVVQLNDTHPALAIAELMRIFVDENNMEWEEAWAITQQTFCYTNHTLLPEALEKWPVGLFASVLPRHLEIVFEINRRFLAEVSLKYANDLEKIVSLSLIDETGERYVRMAHLACVGSHKINGVSELHSNLLKTDVLKDFYSMTPEKFCNKTNGISPRRFLLLSNPELSAYVTSFIGDGWVKDLTKLRDLEKFADRTDFRVAWQNIKRKKKSDLANHIKRTTGVVVDPDTLFDVQAKRIHEYKRQHLNVLHAISLYNRLRNNPNLDITPRTIIFAGKAAPGYYLAKLIIKLVNAVAEKVNNDVLVRDRLKVVFVPNYNVKVAQLIYPGADLSEQISTAGKEASGTGNMKFSLNGALTIGTLDGANIEMEEEFGSENFFAFGLSVDEIQEMRKNGYNPGDVINANQELKGVLDLISSGYFSQGDTGLFKPVLDTLYYRDEFMVCADYQLYIDCQDKVGETYKDVSKWAKMSILNVARSGKFSADRAIKEYADDIWHIEPVHNSGLCSPK